MRSVNKGGAKREGGHAYHAFSRRDFLKATGLGAGAVILGGCGALTSHSGVHEY